MQYAARNGAKEFVVVDGVKGPEFDGIVGFAPAKLTFDSTDVLTYLAVRGENLFRVTQPSKP